MDVSLKQKPDGNNTTKLAGTGNTIKGRNIGVIGGPSMTRMKEGTRNEMGRKETADRMAEEWTVAGSSEFWSQVMEVATTLDMEKKEMGEKETEGKETERKETEREGLGRKERKKMKRKEQLERKELEREETEKKEIERKESERIEMERKEKNRRETERKESERMEMERKEKERKETVRKEMERKEIERKESERMEMVRKEKERKENERKASERMEIEGKERERKEIERKEMERKELERMEIKKKEMERKESQRKESERMEIERKEMEMKETDRKEEAKDEKMCDVPGDENATIIMDWANMMYRKRKAMKKKEMERKETERKETEKKELERKETERKRMEEGKMKELGKDFGREDILEVLRRRNIKLAAQLHETMEENARLRERMRRKTPGMYSFPQLRKLVKEIVMEVAQEDVDGSVDLPRGEEDLLPPLPPLPPWDGGTQDGSRRRVGSCIMNDAQVTLPVKEVRTEKECRIEEVESSAMSELQMADWRVVARRSWCRGRVEDVQFSPPPPSSPRKRELLVVGLEESAAPCKIVEALCGIGSCPKEDIRMGPIRTRNNGPGMAWVQLPVAAALKAAKEGRVRVGSTTARVELLKVRPLQCFKCWKYGHVQYTCHSEVDRRGKCFKCGQIGHVANTCHNAAHCALCHDSGRKATHRLGGFYCMAVVQQQGTLFGRSSSRIK